MMGGSASPSNSPRSGSLPVTTPRAHCLRSIKFLPDVSPKRRRGEGALKEPFDNSLRDIFHGPVQGTVEAIDQSIDLLNSVAIFENFLEATRHFKYL